MIQSYAVLLLLLRIFIVASDDDNLAKILPTSCGYKGPKLQRELRLLNRSKRVVISSKIAGGTHDLIKNHPWQAALVTKEKEHQCGGSVVSKYHVFTAAHCFFVENTKTNTSEGISPDERLIVVSSASPTENGLYYEILHLHLHKKYAFSWGGYDNDIALVQIKGEFSWTAKVFPICLPESAEQYTSGRACIISGYGEDRLDTTVGLLKFGEVEVKSDQECREKYANSSTAITDNMFCAGGYTFDEEVIDSCKGDSGGPLYCQTQSLEAKHVLLGVTSFGVTCGQKRPGVYVKITKFLPWIHDKLKIAEIPTQNVSTSQPTTPTVSVTNPVSNLTWRDILPRNCGLREKKLNDFIKFNTNSRKRRLVNGDTAAIESHPWQVAIIDKAERRVCSGSIISSYHVLTSSFCFFRRIGMRWVYVDRDDRRVAVIGPILGTRSSHAAIEELYLHQYYAESNRARNDIALVKTEEAFKFSAKNFPICLPTEEDPYDAGRWCLISGHGFSSKTERNEEMILYSGKVRIQFTDYCKKMYNNRKLTEAMFCAYGLNSFGDKIDYCNLDGGAAIQCPDRSDKFILMGITAFGNGCDQFDYRPTVYTKVSKYLNWIHDNLEHSMGYRTLEEIRPEVDVGGP